MFQLILFMASTLLSFIFMQMNHPLAMGLLLLLQTLIVCLLTGAMTHSFWFSYILFLVFIGGLLVLFIYVTSLASNEMFTLSTKPMIFMAMITLTTITVYLILDPSMLTTNTTTSDMAITHSLDPLNLTTTSLLKLYNQPTGVLTSILILYLFLTLIAVVKITSIFYGPLRQKN